MLFYGPTDAVLAVAVRPRALLGVAAGLVVGGIVWVLLIVLTHRDTLDPRMARRQRLGLRMLTAVLCILVVVPVAEAARYALIQRGVVGSVFAAGDEHSDMTGLLRPGFGSDPWSKVGRVNVLLLGSDAGKDREGVRTDSMILASIQPATGRTVLLSLPRNLENVPFPKDNPLSKVWPRGFNCGSECLLNAVWKEAESRRELFPGDPRPGLTTVRGVIQEVLGLPVDYYVIVDLQGFQSLVDAMGGVVVNVRERLPIEGFITGGGRVAGIEGWVEPGVQRLDGYHALWFARSRLLSDDYSRMRRQRCLVGKIVEQVNPAMMLQKYPELARVASENIVTDIPATDLPGWVRLVNRIQQSEIQSLAFTDANISVSRPDFAKIRAMANEAVLAPPPTPAPPAPTSSPSTTGPPTGTPTTATPSDTLVAVDQAC